MGHLFFHFQPSWRRSFLKNLVNCSFWAFCLFGVYFVFIAGTPGWIYPRTMGIFSWLSAFLVAIPFLVYHRTSLRTWYRERFVGVAEFLIGIPLAMNGLGALYFFDALEVYDNLLHITASLFGVLLIYLVIGSLWRHETAFDRIVLFFVAVTGGFVAGVMMEVFEFVMDWSLETSMWGQTGQNSWNDTITDLVADSVGVAFAGLGLFFWGKQLFDGLRRVQPRIEQARERAVQWSREKRVELTDQMHETRERVKKKIKHVSTETLEH